MAARQEKRQCFIVGPIGAGGSDDRVHADWLLEGIIEPVFRDNFDDFKIVRADKISTPGSINEQVITALLESELVIADITTLNANAFYEIGIRHTALKPIIHMHLDTQKIPFDIAGFRSIPFSLRHPRDLRNAQLDLKSFTETVLAQDYVVDNPVTFARGKIKFEQTATPPEKVLLEQMLAIQGRIESLESSSGSTIIRRAAYRPAGSDQNPGDYNLRFGMLVRDISSDASKILDVELSLTFGSYRLYRLLDGNYEVRVPDIAENRDKIGAFLKKISSQNEHEKESDSPRLFRE